MSDTFLFRLSIVNAGRYGLTGLIWAASSYACLVLGSYLHAQRNGLTLEDKRGQFCSGVFIGGGHIGCHHAKSRMSPSPAARRKSPAEMVTQPFQQHAAHANKSSGI